MIHDVTLIVVTPPFDSKVINGVLELHKGKDVLIKRYLVLLLSNSIKEVEHSDFYIVLGYYDNNLISSTFLYLPNKSLPVRMRFAFIANIIIAPEFRKQGIATQSIKICEDISKNNDCLGILLASSDEEVRHKLYRKLDFHQYRKDEWLLKKDISIKYPVENLITQFWKVSLFDLATIQSICAFPHYRIIENTMGFIDCSEIEEDFYKNIMNFPNQYLYISDTTILWIISKNNGNYDIFSNKKFL